MTPNVALQCARLSRRGGGLPEAILPVATRLRGGCVLVCHEGPDAPAPVDVITVSAAQTAWRGGRLLEQAGADIVHTHGLWGPLSLAALQWRRATGGATIVSPHGMLDPWALAHKRGRKALAMRLVERAHLNGSAVVHALSAAEYETMRAAGVTVPIAVIPNGIDLPRDPPPPAPDWMDKPTLLFLGRLHAKKGLCELIEAWAVAQRSLPGWQLAIAGWDDGPNRYRTQAAQSGAAIVFPGPLYGADKAAAYAHCAAFVLPSHSEGLPMTVLEAWSHGKPVLMTDACNLPEGFAAGAAACLTTDPREMAQALAHYLADPSFLQNAGTAGRVLVAARFAWDAVARQFAELYRFAAGAEAAPQGLRRLAGQERYA